MEFFIKKGRGVFVIYILCPEKKVTGGTEAMHQLHYYMKLQGIKSYIVYHDIDYKYVQAHVPDRYSKYVEEDAVISGNMIEDSSRNLLIVSESATALLWKYHSINKVVWWLSVGYYDGGMLHFRNSIKHWLKISAKNAPRIGRFSQYHHPYPVENARHYCASKYAFEFVTKKLKQPATMLVEPISKEFLDAGMYTLTEGRQDVIAYNPAKPSKIMQRLLKRGNFDFVPIQNMSANEIINTFRKIKLYVDFGAFPGPERIPKEAAYNGANILVGKRNAAINEFDVNIPEIYKLKNTSDIVSVEKRIGDMLTHFEDDHGDFDVYRNQIDMLERNFAQGLNRFSKYDNE